MNVAVAHDENTLEKNNLSTNLWELLKQGETDGRARNHIDAIKESLKRRKKNDC